MSATGSGNIQPQDGPLFSVLLDRAYRHLFLAQVVARVRTGLATVALGLLAYDIAGKAAQFWLSHACWVVAYPLVGWLGARVSSPTSGWHEHRFVIDELHTRWPA